MSRGARDRAITGERLNIELESQVAGGMARRCAEVVVECLEILGFAELDGEMDKRLYRQVEPHLREALGLATEIGLAFSKVEREELDIEAAKASIMEEM